MSTKITTFNKFTDFPFAELGSEILAAPEEREYLVSKFITTYGLKTRNSWFLPQLVAYISNWTLPSTAKINAKEFLNINVRGNDFNTGIYYLCIHRLRGEIVNSQISKEGLPYSALVPLLMMPFKKLHNVDYSVWDRNEIFRVLDPNMYEFLSYAAEPMSREDMIAFRTEGLTYVSGTKKGSSKSVTSTIKLNNAKGMPWYYQVATFQIWVGHPSLRHKYMILDNQNLDNMPEPLISTEVLAAPKTVPTYVNPWD